MLVGIVPLYQIVKKYITDNPAIVVKVIAAALDRRYGLIIDLGIVLSLNTVNYKILYIRIGV